MRKIFMGIIIASVAVALSGCGDEEKKPAKLEEVTDVKEAIEITGAYKDDSSDHESSVDWQGLKDAYEEDFLNDESSEQLQDDVIYIKDYVTVTFEGYEDGMENKTEITVDWERLEKDVNVPGIDSDFLEACFAVYSQDLEYCMYNGQEYEICVGDATDYASDFTKMYADEIAMLKENAEIVAENFYVTVEGLKQMSYVKDIDEVDISNIMSLIDAEAEAFMDIQNGNYIGDSTFQVIFDWYKVEDCSVNSYELVDSYFAVKKISSYSDSEAKELPNNMLCNIYKVNITRDSTGELLDVYVSVSASDLIDESGVAVFEWSNGKPELRSGISEESVMTDTSHMDITKLN